MASNFLIKPLVYLGLATVLFSCGGPDPHADAQEVCDCFVKANSLPEEDPKRSEAQDKCSTLQMNKLSRYRTSEEQKNFTDALIDCGNQIMRNALENEVL